MFACASYLSTPIFMRNFIEKSLTRTSPVLVVQVVMSRISDLMGRHVHTNHIADHLNMLFPQFHQENIGMVP